MGVSGITPHVTRAARTATRFTGNRLDSGHLRNGDADRDPGQARRLSEAHKAQMLDALLGRSCATRRVQVALARGLFCLGVGANGTTILGFASGLVAGSVFARGFTIVGILLLGASALFDAVDGTIAREFAVPTLFGGILDLCSDRVVEIAVITGITWRRPELYFPALILIGSWYLNITVFLAVGAAFERRGPKLIDYPPGLVERTELIIFFVVLAMSRQHFGPWLCYAYSGLELITATQRLLFARRMVKGLIV